MKQGKLAARYTADWSGFPIADAVVISPGHSEPCELGELRFYLLRLLRGLRALIQNLSFRLK